MAASSVFTKADLCISHCQRQWRPKRSFQQHRCGRTFAGFLLFDYTKYTIRCLKLTLGGKPHRTLLLHLRRKQLLKTQSGRKSGYSREVIFEKQNYFHWISLRFHSCCTNEHPNYTDFYCRVFYNTIVLESLSLDTAYHAAYRPKKVF